MNRPEAAVSSANVSLYNSINHSTHDADIVLVVFSLQIPCDIWPTYAAKMKRREEEQQKKPSKWNQMKNHVRQIIDRENDVRQRQSMMVFVDVCVYVCDLQLQI